MINTRSQFYYGHTVDETNFNLDFVEGTDPALVAEVEIGEYTITDFCTAVARAMNLVGNFDYSVTVNRSTRIITISASGSFKVLPVTGDNTTTSVLPLIGITADTGLATSHAGIASGFVWRPQRKAQSFVDFDDQQKAVDGVSRQSTNGKVESVRFGTTYTMDAQWDLITDIPQYISEVETDLSGVDNARSFLEYATTKADLEFMPDRNDPSTYVKCILESTPTDKDGLGFKLQEQYARGLVGYFDTGVLKFRKIV